MTEIDMHNDIVQLRAKLREVERERDEARGAVIEANNSLYGSQGYFLSLDGTAPNRHHLSEGIEALKLSGKKNCTRAEAAERERDDLKAQLAAAEQQRDEVWTCTVVELEMLLRAAERERDELRRLLDVQAADPNPAHVAELTRIMQEMNVDLYDDYTRQKEEIKTLRTQLTAAQERLAKLEPVADAARAMLASGARHTFREWRAVEEAITELDAARARLEGK